MIVTHPSSSFDARLASKRGIDDAVRFGRNHRIPVIVLQDESAPQFYFMDECSPDYRVASVSGEITFDMTPSQVFVVGGHLELCLGRTVNDIIEAWARQPMRRGRDLTVTYLMDGIYSTGREIQESDRFYKSFRDFMGIVTWGRPAGEHWPKLTLLETMGVIGNETDQIDYLKRILPRYDRTMPKDYRIALRLESGPDRVLRAGRGWFAPTLRFEFVESAPRYQDLMQ